MCTLCIYIYIYTYIHTYYIYIYIYTYTCIYRLTCNIYIYIYIYIYTHTYEDTSARHTKAALRWNHEHPDEALQQGDRIVEARNLCLSIWPMTYIYIYIYCYIVLLYNIDTILIHYIILSHCLLHCSILTWLATGGKATASSRLGIRRWNKTTTDLYFKVEIIQQGYVLFQRFKTPRTFISTLK